MWRSPSATSWVGLGVIIASLSLAACQDLPTRLTFEPNELSFRQAGETVMIEAKAYNRQGKRVGTSITWSSQEPEVASVSSTGLVTAVGHGTTQIVAQVEGTDIIEFVPVAVRLPAKIEIRPGSTSCFIGNSKLLKATVLDRGGKAYEGTTIEWTSSNTKVATVTRNGEVEGMDEGEVIITARALGLEGQSNISVSWDPMEKARIAAEKRGGGGGGGGGGRGGGGGKTNGNGFTDPRLGIFDD